MNLKLICKTLLIMVGMLLAFIAICTLVVTYPLTLLIIGLIALLVFLFKFTYVCVKYYDDEKNK